MSETSATSSDLWHPLGEQRWRELSEGTGASELQLRFAAARFGGATASRAAKLAGYSDDGEGAIRRAGYSALRSTAVQNLLELAAINAPGDAKISDKEIDAKVARLIRSGDPNVVIKAAELHSRREAARKEAENNEPELPFHVVMLNEARGLLGCGVGGLLHVAAMHLGIIGDYGPRVAFTALPLFSELAPNIKAEYPEVWQRILNSLDADCRREAERLALATPGNIATLMEKPKVFAHATE
jgi:hypothetical protein